MSKSFDEYQAGRFASTADTPLGRELWKLITDEKSLLAMEVASDLGQPAIAGIEERLLEKFHNAILLDRIKQLAGHMVRQAMESRGFIVDQNDVKLNSVPFSKATRYRKPDWHTLHVFRSTSDARELCFADSRASDRLPAAPGGGKWRYWNSFSSSLRGAVAFGIKPQEVRDEVKAKGYSRRRMERILRVAS